MFTRTGKASTQHADVGVLDNSFRTALLYIRISAEGFALADAVSAGLDPAVGASPTGIAPPGIASGEAATAY
jgi:hypothetical protein